MTTIHIPVKCMERIVNIFMPDITDKVALKIDGEYRYFEKTPNIEWIDENGMNTPYLVTTINKEQSK